MKKIAFLINEFGYGGVENQIVSLAESLVDLYKIEIVCLKKVIKENINKKISVREIDIKDTFLGIGYDKKLVKCLNGFIGDYDIIVVNDNVFNNVIDKLNISDKQVYYWLHNKIIESKNKLSKYDNVILPNKYLNYDLRLDNAIVIPNVIVLPNKRCIYKDNKKLIFVGKLNKSKRLDDLIDIMEKLIHIDNNIVLNIVGDGDERVELIQNIKDKGLEKNVLLLGTCYLDEIIEELIDSSVFITTSEVETFNLAILQAMSVGLPVVCFENESTKSLITNEIDGILVENRNLDSFSDNIIDLINDLDKRNNIGECAIEKSINYDVNVIKREWIKLFK